MRICPKCQHLSGDRAEHCDACGYQIVLHLTPKPKPQVEVHGRRRRRAKPRPLRQSQRDRTWDGVGVLCDLHGADCDPATCNLRHDLIESDLL